MLPPCPTLPLRSHQYLCVRFGSSIKRNFWRHNSVRGFYILLASILVTLFFCEAPGLANVVVQQGRGDSARAMAEQMSETLSRQLPEQLPKVMGRQSAQKTKEESDQSSIWASVKASLKGSVSEGVRGSEGGAAEY